ncbi:hypothetical protein Clacol_008754 [Clathrus columnatus]|uniref:Uncharacterized protein n=1 Tax=Clathrus columnatus TaxID=1419009 RepID=A0AAV5AJD8_9AGAM|nr:hypothetical protein Clacol_008754 [Clathrus columnatus]
MSTTDFEELLSLIKSLTPEEVSAYRHEVSMLLKKMICRTHWLPTILISKVIGSEQLEWFPNLFPINKPQTWIQLPRLCQWLINCMQGPKPTPYIKKEIKKELEIDFEAKKENQIIIDLTHSPKRKKSPKKSYIINISDSESELEKYLVKKRKQEDLICITQKLKVHHVETLTSIPCCWCILKSNLVTDSVAYLLDLSNFPHKWIDDKGEAIGMDTIIREQDQDNWGGSGSHTTDIEKYCTRYDFDDGQTCKIWEAERNLNIEQGRTPDNILAIFYNYIRQHVCSKDGVICGGAAVVRAYRDASVSLDGKKYFIGCEKWLQNDPEGMHRFIPIPYNINEQKLKILIQEHAEPFLVEAQPNCSLVVPRRIGAKMKQCPFPHTNEGLVVNGHMIVHPCPAQIELFVPLNKSDHRTCIVPRAMPHNHPAYQERKLSIDAKEKYTEAVKLFGPMSATVGKVDQAASTRNILGGVSPPKYHSGLMQRKTKARIIKKLKDKEAPQGYDFPGVVARMQDQRKLPKEEQYIHRATDINGIHMIVTMLPRFAEKLHFVTSSLHDNTYKRITGDCNEWEVVIWDHHFNMRLSVARIYCNRETADAFEQIWSAYFEVIEEVTGRPLKIPIFHKEGLFYAFLTDGDAGQAIGLGQYLAKINDPQVSGIYETDPATLVQYVLKTCWTHCAKNLDTLSTCLDDPKDIRYLKSFEHLSTMAEINQWKEWCKNHPRKQIRDWFENKIRHRWYLPSLVQSLSRMPVLHWNMTPRNTNSGESAHAHTNLHTGTHLSLLVAIDRAYEFDRGQEEKIMLSEKSYLLPDSRNTFSQRVGYNIARAAARARTGRQHASDNEKVKELEKLKQQLNAEKETARVQFLPAEERREAAERRKHIQERIRTLRDEGITLRGRKSKVLQNTTGSSAINQSISTSLHLSSDILPVLSLPTTNNDPLFSLPYSHANGTVIDLDPELDPGSYFGHSNGRVSEYSPTTDVFGPILGQGLGRGLGFNETGDFVKQWQY